MHNFSLIKFYIQPICIACIFYINYLWLIDKVLFRKKTIRFILYNLLLIVMANVAIYLVHRMVIPESILHQRPTPIPPPRPGFMHWHRSRIEKFEKSTQSSFSIQYAQQYLLAYRYQSRTGPKRSS